MARKEITVNLIDGGEKKKFLVRQFSASQGERVRLKMMFLLGANTDIDKLQSSSPYEFIGALINAAASQPYEKVQEVLNELTSCVSRVNDGIESQLDESNIDGFIDETDTLLKLRGEVIKLNGFFQQSGPSNSSESPDPATITIKRSKG
jgi:hypothetical protein